MTKTKTYSNPRWQQLTAKRDDARQTVLRWKKIAANRELSEDERADLGVGDLQVGVVRQVRRPESRSTMRSSERSK